MTTYYFSLNFSVSAESEGEAYLKAREEVLSIIKQISDNDLPSELPFEIYGVEEAA